MVQKISISLDIPVCFKRIANGERVIEQTGPDKIEVGVREDERETKGKSWIQELNELLNEAEREMRRNGRACSKSGSNSR